MQKLRRIDSLTQLNHQDLETAGTEFPVERFLLFYGLSLDERSNLLKAARVLPHLKPLFTVPQLSEAADIPRSKGYPTIRQLLVLKFVEEAPKVERPGDWHEYTRAMRKRFNLENGLPLRGSEPRRYRFSPGRAVCHARAFLNRRVLQIDRDATDRIRELNGIYAEILDASNLPF